MINRFFASRRALGPFSFQVCASTALILCAGMSTLAQDLPAQGAGATDPAKPAVPPEEQAAAESQPAHEEESQFERDEKFHVSFTPYMWLTSLNGTAGMNGLDFDIDASFIDIVDNTNTVFGLMGALEFNWDRIIVQTNVAWVYAQGDDERGVAEDLNLKTDLTSNAVWIEAMGGYRLLDKGIAEINDPRRFTFDAFAGGRVTIVDMESDFELSGSVTLPDGTVVGGTRSTSVDETETWVEPFVGLRMGVDITKRIGLSLRGDVGGFGAGSDFAWQFIGGLGYTFHMGSWNGTALVGFRALSQDYESNDFKWDMTVYGPILGVQFTF